MIAMSEDVPVPTVKGLYNCGYFNVSFLEEAAESLRKKAIAVSVGYDRFTTAEILAYEILKSQGYFPDESND